ncbi:MAG: single-stranded-DNA-specific exonuclease RecJ [Oscillospiraceae bacterium]|nr:single-stranded-DNA-specific exonuclease RecJ [Oscillospiraceae bacterium]
MMKKWVVGHSEPDAVNRISELGVSRLCAEVLSARGIDNAEKASQFISECALSDPFELAGMQRAVDAINEAVYEEKIICIYGDYDCDGIAATAMLYLYLECIGAQIFTYIPERSEGYGINKAAVDKISDMGAQLIITVDNGISAIDEAEYISSLGIDLVVTDHHQPSGELPVARAVVNPHRADCPSTFKQLCGAGVVLKLIAAMEGGDYDMVFGQFGDLAAIATIADIVDICSENRYIVKNGLEILENTENIGLAALLEACSLAGKKLDSNTIGFMLTPKINAAGRFASPKIALDLILCDDEDEALELAYMLVECNNSRRLSESEIMAQIDAQIAENPQLLCQRVLVISGENWHMGVIGIICARLVERYSKPCFVISSEDGEARGSARSFEGFSIFKCLDYCADVLTNYGGHLGAGGFSLKTQDIEKFEKLVLEYATSLGSAAIISQVKVDKLLRKDDFGINNVTGLHMLAPFGMSNPEPVFLIAGARVDAVTPLGGAKHCKLTLYYDNTRVYALLFRVSSEKFKAHIGEKIDALVTLEINEWNGRSDVSVKIKDYRISGINQQKYFVAKQAYEDYICDIELDKAYYGRMIPSKAELRESYKQLYVAKGDMDTAFARLCRIMPDMNYCKFRIAVDIFCEKGIAEFDYAGNFCNILPCDSKVDILSSKVLYDINSKAQAAAR